ncbi:hypothetical protein H7F33_18225 [Pedobacter sp. PAMC26386]|nr:hypothetical protein H7F33_18225 [Pedobacter sp. PAMC26386]
MKPVKQPLFWKAALTFLGLAIFGLIIFLKAGQTKGDLTKTTGAITFLSDNYKNIDERNAGKMCFFMIDSSPEVFEVFIGKESGDFKPDLEKMYQLKKGDIIDIYYDTNYLNMSSNEEISVNRALQFIDKNNEPVFIKGNTDQLMGTGIAGFSLLCIGILIVLKLKGYIF